MLKVTHPVLLLLALIPASIAGVIGCASVGGQSQVLVVDSQPRGLEFEVKNSQRVEPKVRTPAAVMVERRRTLDLKIGFGDFQTNLELKCRFRTGTVLLGNAPASLLLIQNPAAALVFYSTLLGIDLLTGAAFDCPAAVSPALDLPPAVASELTPTCSRVLVIPPAQNSDLKLEQSLIDEAKEYAKRMGSACVDFVSQTTATGALIKSSIQDGSVRSVFADAGERKWAQLLRDSGANQAVDIQIDPHGDKFTVVTFSLWDLYTKKQISSFKKTFRSENFEKLKGGILSTALGRVLRIVPNSIVVSQSKPTLNIESNVQYTSSLIGTRSSLLGLLSISSVEHPDQFDEWDGAFQISPSLYFDSIRHTVRPSLPIVETSSDGAIAGDGAVTSVSQQQFRGYAFNLPIDGVLSLHTPAGAFRVFIGYGLGSYYSTAYPRPKNQLKLFGLAHAGLDWVAYFADNFFVQLGAHAFSRGQDQIEQRGEFALNGWNSTVLGVGYFFPGSRGMLASLFN